MPDRENKQKTAMNKPIEELARILADENVRLRKELDIHRQQAFADGDTGRNAWEKEYDPEVNNLWCHSDGTLECDHCIEVSSKSAPEYLEVHQCVLVPAGTCGSCGAVFSQGVEIRQTDQVPPNPDLDPGAKYDVAWCYLIDEAVAMAVEMVESLEARVKALEAGR